MFLVIVVWIVCISFLLITLIKKAGLHLAYDKILTPDKFRYYNTGFEYLISFSIRRYLVFLPIVFRRKKKEEEIKELKQLGNKLTTTGLLYFSAIILNAAYLYYLTHFHFR